MQEKDMAKKSLALPALNPIFSTNPSISLLYARMVSCERFVARKRLMSVCT
jgi:hypothetical protein